VLFEAAHWDPVMVGRTARRHKLFSEAAKRWERGVETASLVAPAQTLAVTALGGRVEGGGSDAVEHRLEGQARQPCMKGGKTLAPSKVSPWRALRGRSIVCSVAVSVVRSCHRRMISIFFFWARREPSRPRLPRPVWLSPQVTP
jgi:hypothetical protein